MWWTVFSPRLDLALGSSLCIFQQRVSRDELPRFQTLISYHLRRKDYELDSKTIFVSKFSLNKSNNLPPIQFLLVKRVDELEHAFLLLLNSQLSSLLLFPFFLFLFSPSLPQLSALSLACFPSFALSVCREWHSRDHGRLQLFVSQHSPFTALAAHNRNAHFTDFTAVDLGLQTAEKLHNNSRVSPLTHATRPFVSA